MTDTTTITMPALGDGVTEATITRWLAAPGDVLALDDPLLEVATDKVDTEVPAPHAGTLMELLAAEEDVVEIGAPLAVLSVEASSANPQAINASATNYPTDPAPEPVVAAEEVSDPTPDVPLHMIAEEQRATADADRGGSARPQRGARTERLPRIRQTIARRMLESLQTTAQLTTVVEVDVTEISTLRRTFKEEFGQRVGTNLSFLPFFASAAVEALAEYPVIAASINDECTEVTYQQGVHLGIAVDGPKGLMVPTIRDAEGLGIAGLAKQIADAAAAVRDGTIGADALTGATFTITNTGSRGALFDTPILNRPQSAILGTGVTVERIVPRRDKDGGLAFAARSMVYLALSYDHRIIDGADAARFLGAVKTRLEIGFTATELFVNKRVAHSGVAE